MVPADDPSEVELVDLLESVLPDDITPAIATEAAMYLSSEAQALFTPQTAVFVLGSYREPERERLDLVTEWLNERPMTVAFLEADLLDIEHPDLPETHVKFHLLAAHSDLIVMILEHGAGGAVTELADLTPPSAYFESSHVFAREYEGDAAKEVENELGVSVDIGEHSPYSAVHRDKFELFAPDRLRWWATLADLRAAVDDLPR